MDDSIKRYKQRRDSRIKEKANADEEWITMKGSHILIDDGGKVKAGAGGKFNGTEYKRGNKNVKEENRPHAGKYVNMLEESGFRKKRGAKKEEIGAKPSEGKTKAESARDRTVESTKTGSPEYKKRAVENFLSDNREKIDSEKGLQIAENNFQWAGMSNEQALKVLNSMGKGEYEIYEEKEPGTMWTNWAPVIKTYIRKKGKAEKKEESAKSGAEAARDRMSDRMKGKAAPAPADLSAKAMREEYSKAVDEGLDTDDVLANYMKGHDIGAKVTVEGMEYEKVGDGKWKPKDKWGARSVDGFERDRDMASRITSAYLTGGKVEVKKGSGSVESPAPRPKTKLETMKDNKERYAKVQEEIKGMKPGLERDVKEKVILPWIKGDKWMGGMPDRKFEQIAKKMPYEVNEIYNEFQKQMMKY